MHVSKLIYCGDLGGKKGAHSAVTACGHVRAAFDDSGLAWRSARGLICDSTNSNSGQVGGLAALLAMLCAFFLVRVACVVHIIHIPWKKIRDMIMCMAMPQLHERDLDHLWNLRAPP